MSNSNVANALTFRLSLIFALTSLLVAVIFYSIDTYVPPYIYLLVIPLATLTITFFVTRYYLDKYIFNQVRLIYRIIKSSKFRGDININDEVQNKSLEDVNEEVVKWAKDTSKEIESMQELQKYRQQFLGDISHELKTPIFAIQGYLHSLLEGGMYDEVILEKYIKKAAINVERLQTIVEDLDLINKLENDKKALNYSKFDIQSLTEEVISEVALIAEENEITFSYKKHGNKNYEVYADRNAIRQVLTNLVINSIKYGKKGGTTKFGFFDMDDTLLVEVSDDGIGIEEKEHKHLFDRFYRVEKSRNRGMGGSGLGLSIVKHIIEAHDQSITVRSTVNVGSTFGFTLQKTANIPTI